MGWFGGGDKEKKKANGGGPPASGGKIRLATNAPRHWPPVTVEGWLPDSPAVNYLTLAAALHQGAESNGGTLALHVQRMYDDGIVTIPIMMTEGDQRTAVFAYPRADEAAASHFSGVRSLLRQRDGINAVYFAPEPIQPAAPVTVVEPIDTPHFARVDKERPPAEYALWWPTPEDPSFASSAALEHLDRWFEALDGLAPFIFSAFVRDLGIKKEAQGSPPELYGLPEQAFMLALDAPAGLSAYLHASRAHGLWLALDVTTPAAQRDTFLKLLADFATQFRTAAEARSAPFHEQGIAVAWWREARAEALRKEAAGGADLHIGHIAEEISARRAEPGPSTGDERQARAAASISPETAIVEFAGVLMDRARVMAGEALASTPEDQLPPPGQPASPSIPPMLSMRTGADTWTILFWDDEVPEATAAARDLIAEHGAVDMAAFVCDIMVTIGGAKTDALLVRAQERGDDRSHAFVQRYVPRRKDQAFGLTGRWALLGREEAIYPANGATSAGESAAPAQPSERSIASVIESITQMISWVTMDDPSGERSLRRDNRENRPMLSPRMMLDGGDEPGRMIMFGMMGEAAAGVSARRAASEDKNARHAAFRYDHVRLKNGEPHREFRVVVHERGTPAAFLFAQRYELPRKGTPFTKSGKIRLIGPVSPLFAD